MLQRTPLFAVHQRLGGRLVEFGGWEMPVQYTGIVDEHHAVRRAAGLFDISHMGQVIASGPGAEAFLNHALTNDVRKLAVGRGQYTLLGNARGGVVDDLYVYRTREQEYLLVVNAARRAADWDALQAEVDHCATRDGFTLTEAYDDNAALAVQGPRVAEFIGQVIPGGSIGGTLAARVTDLRKNQIAGFVFRGDSVLVARTGYTGEDGFEIMLPAGRVEELWTVLLEAGTPAGLKPVGLGARDTLRTEMGFPLYGHELDEQTTPLEAGLGTFVAFDKGDFVGRATLAEQKEHGVPRQRIAFRMTGRSAPPRPGYAIWSAEPPATRLGTVTSGTQSPSLEAGIGMGYVPPAFATPGTKLAVEIRGQHTPGEVQGRPLYRRPPGNPTA